MTETKTATIGDFLTDEEILLAAKIYREDPEGSHKEIKARIIVPNLERINKSLGQDNDPDYLTFAVEFALVFSTEIRDNDGESDEIS